LTQLKVALDLDETLVHTAFEADEEYSILKFFDDYDCFYERIHLELENGECAFVQFRPGLASFLHNVTAEFDVTIFTAGASHYGRPVVRHIDPTGGDLLESLLCRPACTPMGNWMLKDLRQLDENLERIVLVDNSLVSFAPQPHNGIPIKSFFGSPDEIYDSELTNVLSTLRDLHNEPDVRLVLEPSFCLRETLLQRCMQNCSGSQRTGYYL
jgi:Dullard-like phosphatase family protein